ncbi:hypothetical protein Mgra_00001971 [Meloidogyne graminicola]|nr:hypothetical protein Mgra_00001971 [Meloidogyne graminicola]
MQSGGSSFNQLQTPQTPHLTTPQQSYRNPHQQKGIGAPLIQQQQFFKHQQPTDVTGVQIPPPPAEINNEETGGICQKQTPIPPPGLVMPPPLGGGSPLPLPPNSSATTFGFFNPVSSTTSGNQPSQIIQSQPPSFQQLQQQVQQVSGPHFPHQPSLLGPSVAAAQAQAMLTAILQSQQQQIGSTQTKKDSHDNLLQQSPPSSQLNKDEVLQLQNIESQPTKTEAQETEANTGGFNINQMLEQITQQNSPPHPPADLIIVKREEANTLDLLANVGLSETKNIIEDSPASPVFATEQIQETEDKPAALIPVVSAWKLHLIDLTPLTETSDMHFDIKLVQQISSSNSDPRLRKIAEKQFDLVSRTLEQQQQQANQHKLNSNEGLIISSNFPFSTENKNQSEQIQKEIEDQEFCEHYEVGVIDPRTKDPRRRSTSGQIIDNKSLSMVNNSTIPDEAELVKKQMAALEAAAKHQQNCEQQSQMFGTQIGIRQQIGLTSPINFQIPPPAFLTGNPISNPCFNVPPPPPFSLPQQVSQNFSLPSTYQQQQTNKIEITNQPKFETQIFSNEQIASSSSSSLDLSNKPTNSSFEKSRSDDSHFPSFHYSGGGYRGRRGRYSHNYQHHKQQYYRENHQRIQRSESPPQLQQQEQTSTSSTNISLREKRKNNEYESPLARMAGNRY